MDLKKSILVDEIFALYLQPKRFANLMFNF